MAINTSSPYVAPELCVGVWDLTACQDTYQENIAAENLNISGAALNVFKLRGIHEQGALVDLSGAGRPLNGSANVFDLLSTNYVSPMTGMAVLTTPSWIGYDFGTLKTALGAEAYAPGANNLQHITSFRIKQPTAGSRALQVRVERSQGNLSFGAVQFTGTGNGSMTDFKPGTGAALGTFMCTALGTTSFSVYFTSASTVLVGVCTVGVRFNSKLGSFLISAGSIPFSTGAVFSAALNLDWLRVDVVNLPDAATPALVHIKQSAASRFWRIVPISFSGAISGTPWEVEKLELFDALGTTLDDIQDSLFMENRDRDYSTQSVQFKVAYQPFDAISDLSKFGFQVADVYNFTTVFAVMVKALGRPIVIGDVLELPSAVQYDHNLKPVKKFLEVTDASWAADGYTSGWRPITFRFQASQLIPSQETRDLFGTADKAKYSIDDSDFFSGIGQQISTGLLTSTEAVQAEAFLASPEKGENTREVIGGVANVGLYVEDGLPPSGLAYTEGVTLPDVAGNTDGAYFRLNYDAKLNIASRLYRFSSIKNKWIYQETDRRNERASMRPSQLAIFNQPEIIALSSKKI